MIKRSESSPSESRRKRTKREKRRRLKMEGLEQRQLLAGDVPTLPVGFEFPTFTEPRNIGAVQAFAFNESESAAGSLANDTIQTADFVPLGTGAGQQDTIDITGTMGVTLDAFGNTLTDVDVYAFDLAAGDILDVALQGAAGSITVLFEDGSFWWGVDDNQNVLPPGSSPLQTVGNAVFAQVAPRAGRYYLFLAPSAVSSNYTVGLRVYRPVSEQLPIGTKQVIYLDFDGGVFPTNLFSIIGNSPFGVVRLSGLRENLPVLGLDNITDAAYNELLDKTIAQVELDYQSVTRNGDNGDYDSTGNAGEFGVTILNSRDHEDPGFNNPLVTRMIIGHTLAELQSALGILGIAQSIDLGNFDMNENALMPMDFFLAAANAFPISNAVSVLDAIARRIGTTASHEAAHTFGLRHTNGDNLIGCIMDDPGVNRELFRLGVGPDGIFGTADDTESEFARRDQFSLNEGIFGYSYGAASIAWGLASGTVGGTASGVVFNDANADGASTLDSGLAGATVFADMDGDGALSPTDPKATTGPDGVFTLNVSPGTFDVIALPPAQFAATTPTSQSATVALGASLAGLEFGFTKVIADITGTKFSDNNGNGLFDPGEPGIGGVYIYLDLDGDDRPDFGEPSAITADDGTYSIDFPGPGTYTIREVVEPGFIQTFPVDGEHTFVFDGSTLASNFNFGNLPSRDFGDALESYRTSIATDGPNHGITEGLSIGTIVDRELDGQPTATATGDDVNGRVSFSGLVEDDEDGVRLLSPLGPGDSATVEVTLTNTSGSPAFLQVWMDFNIDGDFDDPLEQVATDLSLGTGVHSLPIFVPATATVGTTYMRLRYSQTPGLGVGGDADTGEVEDYSFPILDAAEVANNDEFSVSRNTQANQLDVLRNDFQTVDNTLTIVGRDISGTNGSVVIAGDGKSVFYTPATGFIGRDVFGYTVRDTFGTESSATVVVNVTFQSAIPIALDDTFEVPEGSVNRALNVLDNDVASTAGGLSIVSVTAGNQGGTITIVGGGQSIRYTPLPGFNGTEQFTYSIQDAVGSVSTAQVTINLLPGSRPDDIVEFSIGIFDVVNDLPITNLQVGDLFNVRIFVDDLRIVSFGDLEGVASAFLDLLYTDELVATVDTDNNPNFPFDISFGELFSGGGAFQTGSAQIPGLFNEIGGVQPISDPITVQQTHSGPVELLTLTMQAVSPGVAIFQADPADALTSETTIIGSDRALDVHELRLGRTELTIVPAQANFASAIDDSFPDSLDSDGFLIANDAATIARLDVLANDIFGPTGSITEFGLVTAASFGNATINNAGTPGFIGDDFIEYVGDLNANGFERFTYVTVSADGIRSTAEVSFPIGNAGANDLVAIDFATVNADGSPNVTGTYGVGDTVGLQVIVEDIRSTGFGDQTFVFAGFLDIMYDAGILSTRDTIQSDDFDFDVVFESDFNAEAAVGTGVRAGIIDEFGTLLIQSIAESELVDNPNLMATIWFTAGTAGTTTVTGGPADASPFQDTLLFRENDPVPVDQIRYDKVTITVDGGPEPEALHNAANPSDVNNDGFTTAIDALLVMNFLGERDAEGEHIASDYFHDVTGEGIVTSRDALIVINEMITARLLAEAEFVVTSPNASATPSSQAASASDQVLTVLEESPIVGEVAATPSGAGAAISSPADNGNDTDDDDDDVIGLLADDVSGLWS